MAVSEGWEQFEEDAERLRKLFAEIEPFVKNLDKDWRVELVTKISPSEASPALEHGESAFQFFHSKNTALNFTHNTITRRRQYLWSAEIKG